MEYVASLVGNRLTPWTLAHPMLATSAMIMLNTFASVQVVLRSCVVSVVCENDLECLLINSIGCHFFVLSMYSSAETFSISSASSGVSTVSKRMSWLGAC